MIPPKKGNSGTYLMLLYILSLSPGSTHHRAFTVLRI